jgi:hypothetical protein
LKGGIQLNVVRRKIEKIGDLYPTRGQEKWQGSMDVEDDKGFDLGGRVNCSCRNWKH